MVDRSSRCYSWGSDIKGDHHLRHSLSRSKHGLLCFVAFEPYSVRLSHSFPRNPQNPKNPHFQNEARCTTFLEKMSFICMRMKYDFHIKGWAPTLVSLGNRGLRELGNGLLNILLIYVSKNKPVRENAVTWHRPTVVWEMPAPDYILLTQLT